MTSIDALHNTIYTRIGRDLGIPDGEPVVCVTVDAAAIGPRFAGYQLEVIGVPPHPGRGHYVIGVEVEGEKIQVWRVRIMHPDMQAFVEARTTPQWTDFYSIDLRNLDRWNTKHNETMLTMGMAMLHGPKWRGGRRRDDSDIEGAIRAIAASGEEPTSGRVANLLYPGTLDPYDSLYKRLHNRDGRRFKLVFEDIKRRALN